MKNNQPSQPAADARTNRTRPRRKSKEPRDPASQPAAVNRQAITDTDASTPAPTPGAVRTKPARKSQPSDPTSQATANQPAKAPTAATQNQAKPRSSKPRSSNPGPNNPASTSPASQRPGHLLAQTSERTGVLRINPRGFGFCDLDALAWPAGPHEALTSCFCPPHLVSGFCDGDTVKVTVRPEPDGRAIATQVTLVQRRRREVFGVVDSSGTGLVIDPYIGAGVWPLTERQTPNTALRARIEPDGRLLMRVSYQNPLALDALRARALCRRALPNNPPDPEPIAEMQPLAKTNRRDLRELTTITIDADHSRDLDDALSVLGADDAGGIRVLVHIADVAQYIPAHSTLDRNARKATTSIYLPGLTRPMLPAAISEDALSLVPGVDRDTLTVELRILQDGQVASVDVFESRIRSTMRISYERCAAALAGTPDADIPATVIETLSWLRAASARLSVARAARGGITATRIEPELAVWMDGDTPNTKKAAGQNEAHMLIERLMVCANESVARWMNDRGLPTLFRNHRAPDASAIASLVAFADFLGYRSAFSQEVTPAALGALESQLASSSDPRAAAIVDVLLGCQSRAVYEPIARGHFGLGSTAYLHFTSPLRRYADLVVHRIVKAYLNGSRNPGEFPSVEELSALGDHINDASHRASLAERDVDRMLWAAAFAADATGPLQGRVSQITNTGVRIRLERSHAMSFARLRDMPGGWLEPSADGLEVVDATGSATLQLGQSVTVKVNKVDVMTGQIDVQVLAGTTKRATKPAARPAKTPAAKTPAAKTPAAKTPAAKTPAAKTPAKRAPRRAIARKTTPTP